MPNNESSVGPVIATIIILAVIVLGGLYFWGQRADNNVPATSADLNSINTQSNSDDSASIQADLENTNTEDLDAQLNAS
ncbi:hypothetical protein KW785_03155 [Candidatus Parcubacteria bacterium]|nr:hypothetical protein [Candidatus Parcubacteria bacterium]